MINAFKYVPSLRTDTMLAITVLAIFAKEAACHYIVF